MPDWIDYGKIKPIRIGILAGDGIGPFIAAESKRVLEFLLKDEVKAGKVEIRDIEGLTIENRVAHNEGHPGRRPGRDQEVSTSPSRARRRRRGRAIPGRTSRAATWPCGKSSTSSPTSGPSGSPSRASTGSSSGRTRKTSTPSAPTASRSTPTSPSTSS